MQADDVGVALFSGLYESWRNVECLFLQILHTGGPWSQCLLVCLFDLAQLKQSLFLNKNSFRCLKILLTKFLASMKIAGFCPVVRAEKLLGRGGRLLVVRGVSGLGNSL